MNTLGMIYENFLQCVATSENAIILCCDIYFLAKSIIRYFNPREHILEV